MRIAEPLAPTRPDLVAPTPPADLRQAWAAMTTLRSVELATTHPLRCPDLAVTLDILGEAVHRTGPSGARRVPSAGAIFPYDTFGLCRTPAGRRGHDWGLFRIEGATGSCTRVPVSRAWSRRLATALPGGPGFEGCYLLVLTRPWLSIRKYGPRGYLYTQLDAAHAAVNITGIALSTGIAVLHTGPAIAATAALMKKFPPFYELHSVIQLTRVSGYPSDPAVAVRTEAPARRTAAVYDFEARAWASIVAPLHSGAGVLAPARQRDTTMLTLPGAPLDLALRTEWRELSAARRSAKRFGTEPMSGAQLAGVIRALATPLPTTVGPGGPAPDGDSPAAVSATVLVNDRLELSPAEQAAITRCARLVRYPASPDSMPRDVEEIIAACMGQTHIARGQAFVLLHTAPGLVNAGATGAEIRQALFRAGAGGQLLCLAATRERVAASTIGGFDSAVWTRIARLPADTELLYLLVLGSPAVESGAARADRLEKASAHGES